MGTFGNPVMKYCSLFVVAENEPQPKELNIALRECTQKRKVSCPP